MMNPDCGAGRRISSSIQACQCKRLKAVAGRSILLLFAALLLTGGAKAVSSSGGAAIGIFPISHDFGTLEPGGNDAFAFTVTNTGDTGELTISNVWVKGPGIAAFAVNEDTCTGAGLDAGASCSIGVSFAPADDGEYTAQLSVISDAGFVGASLKGSSGTKRAFFQGLGIPEGKSGTMATAVSGDGMVVGGAIIEIEPSSGDESYEAFRWQDGELVGLGNLPDPMYPNTNVEGISDDGSVIVGMSFVTGAWEAFYWKMSSGVMTRVADLSGDQWLSLATSVSGDGSVVAGIIWTIEPPLRAEAFRWDVAENELITLGHLPQGGSYTTANAISADGSIIVGSSFFESGIGGGAYRWEDGEMLDLGFLPGDAFSGAWEISSDGTFIVGFSGTKTEQHAFRWSNGRMLDLGDLPGTIQGNFGGISDDGSIVVGDRGTEDGGFPLATIWKENRGWRSLQEVLENDYGLDLSGWTLMNATGISKDGTVIVGTAVNPDGAWEGYRVALGTVGDHIFSDEFESVISRPDGLPESR